ncbi:MAG: GIY-YIG nuclease family protein [Candidatus Uhrbacteria bacterium]|nr:GIY-YIG nuclease family protein [Candidatus Uhrbacteria bacterium]
MYFVYVLQSGLDQNWYIGFSESIEHRVYEHNSRKNYSTKSRRPWKLIYYEAYLNKLDALGRERFLKSGSGHRFLKKQMTHYFSNVSRETF